MPTPARPAAPVAALQRPRSAAAPTPFADLLGRLEGAAEQLSRSDAEPPPAAPLYRDLRRLGELLRQPETELDGCRERLSLMFDSFATSAWARQVATKPLKEARAAARQSDADRLEGMGDALLQAMASQPHRPADAQRIQALVAAFHPSILDMAHHALAAWVRDNARQLLITLPMMAARVPASEGAGPFAPLAAAFVLPTYPQVLAVDKTGKKQLRRGLRPPSLRAGLGSPTDALLRVSHLEANGTVLTSLSNTRLQGAMGKVRVGNSAMMGAVAIKEQRRDTGVGAANDAAKTAAVATVGVLNEVGFTRLAHGDSFPLLHLHTPKSHFLMMPLMDVGDLEHFSRQVSRGAFGLSTVEVETLYFDVARQLSEQLLRFQQLSGGSIVRDIKPANVLLDSQRGALLADFGLVMAPRPGTLDFVGETRGTPGYSAPEVMGERPVGPKVDVFSLSRALASLLLKRQEADPFFGDDLLPQVRGDHAQAERLILQSYSRWHARQPRLADGKIDSAQLEPRHRFSTYFSALARRHPAVCDAMLNNMQHPDAQSRWDSTQLAHWASTQFLARPAGNLTARVFEQAARVGDRHGAVLEEMLHSKDSTPAWWKRLPNLFAMPSLRRAG